MTLQLERTVRVKHDRASGDIDDEGRRRRHVVLATVVLGQHVHGRLVLDERDRRSTLVVHVRHLIVARHTRRSQTHA